MLKIIESVHDKPIKMVWDKVSKLAPGTVCQLLDGICGKSDGSRPFGIVQKVSRKTGLVFVWFETMIFRSSEYELEDNFDLGDKLFCSKNGKLTNVRPNEESLILGHCTRTPSTIIKYIEVDWI